MGKVIELWPNTESEIEMFFNCGECLEELPSDTSPRDYQRLEVGWTIAGFQVWCKRHDMNIIHMDFEGHTHPAK